MAPRGLFAPAEPYEHGWLNVGEDNEIYWETCGNPADPAIDLSANTNAHHSPTHHPQRPTIS